MTKVVFNACFGGFSVSETGMRRYAELKGITLYVEQTPYGFASYWTVPQDKRPSPIEGDAWYQLSQDERIAVNKAILAAMLSERDFKRNDPTLVQVVEELGSVANGAHANLQIAEIPDGSKYRIDEYDGSESVETPDSYEWETA